MTYPLYIFTAATLAAAWVFIMVVLFYLLAPLTFWFEYTDVAPTQSVFINAQPSFYSTAIFYRNVRIEWNDVLRCTTHTGLGYYSEQNTSDIIRKDTAFSGLTPWQYLAPIPVPPATCQVTHNITATFPFGINRTQTIVSDKFDIR